MRWNASGGAYDGWTVNSVKSVHSNILALRGQPGATGVASSQSDDVAKRLAPSDLCRCLSLGLSQDRSAQATAGSPQHGQNGPSSGVVRGVHQGSISRLHQLATL